MSSARVSSISSTPRRAMSRSRMRRQRAVTVVSSEAWRWRRRIRGGAVPAADEGFRERARQARAKTLLAQNSRPARTPARGGEDGRPNRDGPELVELPIEQVPGRGQEVGAGRPPRTRDGLASGSRPPHGTPRAASPSIRRSRAPARYPRLPRTTKSTGEPGLRSSFHMKDGEPPRR